MNSERQIRPWLPLMFVAVITVLAGAVVWRSAREKREVDLESAVLWLTSLNSEMRPNRNNYSWDNRFPSIGVIHVRSGFHAASEGLDSEVFANALTRMREEFGYSYRRRQLIGLIYDDNFNPTQHPFHPQQILIVILGGDDSDGPSTYIKCATIAAPKAFDDTIRATDVIAGITISDCSDEPAAFSSTR